MFKEFQFWRIWTRGWGFRDWFQYVKNEGFHVWLAWRIPHKVALWTFIRVYAHSEMSPGEEYRRVYEAWAKTPCPESSSE